MSNTTKITNEEFNLARKKHKAFITSVTKKFSNVLSPDAQVAAGDIGLWRCMQKHKPGVQKFTSSLSRFVQWECLNYLHKDKCESLCLLDDVECQTLPVSTHVLLEEYLSLLSDFEQRVIRARYLENCTLEEIAQQEGYSKQGIRCVLHKAMRIMSREAKFGV